MLHRRACKALYASICLLGVAACGSDQTASTRDDPGSAAGSPAALSPLAQLGEQIFHDTSLSASGRQSCASCHVETRAFTADPATDHGLPVPLGGPDMDLPGFRNTPTLMYVSFAPSFFIAPGNTPTGGFFRDGRASSLAIQAQQPFVTGFEMANQSPAEVATRLRASSATLQPFIGQYGGAVLDDPTTVLRDLGLALAAYETEAPEFHPFSSKFDYWLAGTAPLSAQEQRGLALFNNPAKGNCAACHPSQRQEYDSHALFTDFTYDNIGVPRNWSIPANAATPLSPIDGVTLSSYLPAALNVPADSEYAYYDLGLCGPFAPPDNDPNPRPTLSATTTLCGLFKVPTLRNIALTAPYFHNGVFSTLEQVVQWYVTRDLNNNSGNNPTPLAAGPHGNPYVAVGTFYTAADGSPDLYQYNDLPPQFDANVNVGEIPYTPPSLAGGQAPTLDAQQINDLVAFLCSLSDGYDPANPAAYAAPAQCQSATAAAATSTTTPP